MGRLGEIPSNIITMPFLYSDWLYLLAWYKDTYSYHLGMSTGDLVKARSPSEFLLTSGVGFNSEVPFTVH